MVRLSVVPAVQAVFKVNSSNGVLSSKIMLAPDLQSQRMGHQLIMEGAGQLDRLMLQDLFPTC